MTDKLDDLQKSIELTREKNRKRIRENYRLARSLGFTSYEAGKLAQRSKESIQELAALKQ